MKLCTLLALLFTVPSLCHAQVANQGFEEWNVENGKDRPAGWTSSPFGAGKDSSAYSGRYAVSVWNWYYSALGTVTTGEFDLHNFGMNNAGVPIDFVPAKLTGYYKYDLGQNATNEERIDSAAVQVVLKRYNPVSGEADTIAQTLSLFPSSNTWIPFSIELPPAMSGLRPDTAVITFYSSNPADPAFCASETGMCCYLSVDDIELTGTSGVPYRFNALLPSARVIPNPVVGDVASFQFAGEEAENYRLRIYDASGRIAVEQEIVGSEADLSSLGLPAGAYHVAVVDVLGVPVAAGRFIVE